MFHTGYATLVTSSRTMEGIRHGLAKQNVSRSHRDSNPRRKSHVGSEIRDATTEPRWIALSNFDFMKKFKLLVKILTLFSDALYVVKRGMAS